MKIIKTAAMALAVPGLLAVSVPASAAAFGQADSVSQQDTWQHGRKRGHYKHGGDYGRQAYYAPQRQQYYDEPIHRDTRVWRGDDNRYYCRKKDGTTGLIIGGAAGALLGREIDGGRSRTLGTILGAAGGALLGREIDRGGSRCR